MHAHSASKIVIACNSASAVYSDTDEVRGIVPFGVSSVLKNNGPQKTLIAENSTVRSGIFRKLFAQHGLPIRQRIAQPLSIQIEKGVLSGEKLENDLQRILKPLKNYDSILLACTHYPAIETEIKKHLKPYCQLLDPVDEMVEWVQQIWPSKQDSVETVFMSTGSPEQLELFRYNSKKVFDVYISKVYPVVQDEMDFTF